MVLHAERHFRQGGKGKKLSQSSSAVAGATALGESDIRTESIGTVDPALADGSQEAHQGRAECPVCPICAQVGPPFCVLPAQGAVARFPEKRKVIVTRSARWRVIS